MSQSPAVNDRLIIVLAVSVTRDVADPDTKEAETNSPTFPVDALSFVVVPGICPVAAVPLAVGATNELSATAETEKKTAKTNANARFILVRLHHGYGLSRRRDGAKNGGSSVERDGRSGGSSKISAGRCRDPRVTAECSTGTCNIGNCDSAS